MNTNDLPLYSLNLGQFKELLKELLKDIHGDNIPKMKGDKYPNQLLKIDDLCKLFNVSKVTIFAWIKKGKLKATHVGTRLYFKTKDIDELIKNNT
jgi:excisionase family DNA binding protein